MVLFCYSSILTYLLTYPLAYLRTWLPGCLSVCLFVFESSGHSYSEPSAFVNRTCARTYVSLEGILVFCWAPSKEQQKFEWFDFSAFCSLPLIPSLYSLLYPCRRIDIRFDLVHTRPHFSLKQPRPRPRPPLTEPQQLTIHLGIDSQPASHLSIYPPLRELNLQQIHIPAADSLLKHLS